MRSKPFFILFFLFVATSLLYGQNNTFDEKYFTDRYKITLRLDPETVKSQKLDKLYMLSFQNGSLTICDSAVVKNNKAVFIRKISDKSPGNLFQKGFVRIVSLYNSNSLHPKNITFSTPLILLNQDVEVEISVKQGGYHADKSPENQSFFTIQRNFLQETNPIKSAIVAADLASAMPNTFLDKYFQFHLQLMKSLQVDSAMRVINSDITVQEFENFIEYTNFSDLRLVNSSDFSGIRLMFKHFFVPENFSDYKEVSTYIDKILTKAEKGGDFQRGFYAKELFDVLQSTGDPFFEPTMLHIYDNYDRSWIPENRVRSMKRQMEKARRLAVGSKIPELTAFDIDKNRHSTTDIKKKYTILWFWDPDCDHCQEQTPILHELYNELSETLDFEVFAVEVNDDYDRWKSFSETHNLNDWINLSTSMGETSVDFVEYFDIVTTPVVLLIDNSDDFAILARQISLEEIVEIMKNNNLK